MGDHKKNSKNKIYSSFACRLGKIVEQYEELDLEENKKYETTLYVCVLQNLLTQFCGIVSVGDEIGASELPIWGLSSSQINKFPKDKNKTLGNVPVNIRDALSHPYINNDCLVYESKNENGEIIEYEFIRKKFQNNNSNRKPARVSF